MTKQELYKLHKELSQRAYDIMQVKNQDYAAGSDDPFFNFRGGISRGVEPEIGLILRMDDKLNRAIAFVKNGELAVPGEGIIDIGLDLINYGILLSGMLIERSGIPFDDLFPRPIKQVKGNKKKKSQTKRKARSKKVTEVINDDDALFD